MKYKINEVAKMLNVSNQLIRYYEQNNLVNPKRDTNGYRYYETGDINLLIGATRYKHMGFSLKESEQFLHNYSLDQSLSRLSNQIKTYEYELIKQELTLKASKEIISELKNLKNTIEKIEIINSQSIYWVPLGEKTEIIGLMPISFISPLINKEKNIEWGFGIKKSDFDQLNLVVEDSYKSFENFKCITTVIETVGNNYLDTSLFGKLNEYIEKNSLEIIHDAWGMTIGNYVDNNGFHHRLHRFYIPIA